MVTLEGSASGTITGTLPGLSSSGAAGGGGAGRPAWRRCRVGSDLAGAAWGQTPRRRSSSLSPAPPGHWRPESKPPRGPNARQNDGFSCPTPFFIGCDDFPQGAGTAQAAPDGGRWRPKWADHGPKPGSYREKV